MTGEAVVLTSNSENCSTANSCCGRDGDPFSSSNRILTRIDESEAGYQHIRDEFISGMGALGKHTQQLNVYRKARKIPRDREEVQLFLTFRSGLEMKRGGDSNEKYAWYGASKGQIHTVLSHGFVNHHGGSIHLSPSNMSLRCLKLASPDEDKVRHLLFCRVLLGRTEVVEPGSDQCCPTSQEFDSGVDNLESPTQYIIWGTRMNVQILPQFAITFKLLLPKKVKVPPQISALFLELSLMLPQAKTLIAKLQKDTEERRVTRKEFQLRLIKLVGTFTLLQALRSCKNKHKELLAS